jgi:hypothetical protein
VAGVAEVKRAAIKMRMVRRLMGMDYIIFADNRKARYHHPGFCVFG